MSTHLTAFQLGFLSCALWSSNDESDTGGGGGEPLDQNYSIDDFDPTTLATLCADCDAFERDNADDLESVDPEQAGHDFWLTRNRHGAGFWDGDYAEPQASRLTANSNAVREINLYVGDDGMIYL